LRKEEWRRVMSKTNRANAFCCSFAAYRWHEIQAHSHSDAWRADSWTDRENASVLGPDLLTMCICLTVHSSDTTFSYGLYVFLFFAKSRAADRSRRVGLVSLSAR
jgi:hypothetical protein